MRMSSAQEAPGGPRKLQEAPGDSRIGSRISSRRHQEEAGGPEGGGGGGRGQRRPEEEEAGRRKRRRRRRSRSVAILAQVTHLSSWRQCQGAPVPAPREHRSRQAALVDFHTTFCYSGYRTHLLNSVPLPFHGDMGLWQLLARCIVAGVDSHGRRPRLARRTSHSRGRSLSRASGTVSVRGRADARPPAPASPPRRRP